MLKGPNIPNESTNPCKSSSSHPWLNTLAWSYGCTSPLSDILPGLWTTLSLSLSLFPSPCCHWCKELRWPTPPKDARALWITSLISASVLSPWTSSQHAWMYGRCEHACVERERDRETERQRDRETERQRDRERERESRTCVRRKIQNIEGEGQMDDSWSLHNRVEQKDKQTNGQQTDRRVKLVEQAHWVKPGIWRETGQDKERRECRRKDKEIKTEKLKQTSSTKTPSNDQSHNESKGERQGGHQSPRAASKRGDSIHKETEDWEEKESGIAREREREREAEGKRERWGGWGCSEAQILPRWHLHFSLCRCVPRLVGPSLSCLKLRWRDRSTANCSNSYSTQQAFSPAITYCHLWCVCAASLLA